MIRRSTNRAEMIDSHELTASQTGERPPSGLEVVAGNALIDARSPVRFLAAMQIDVPVEPIVTVDPAVTVLVLASAFMHALWNALVKVGRRFA